jgi:hypothetical protein
VTGESVAAVGFVPRTHGGDGETSVEAASSNARTARAIGALRAAGNEPPPRSFDDEQDFVAALRRRDHRGALALVEPRLSLDGSGSPVHVAFLVLEPRLGAGYVKGADGEPEHNVTPAVDRCRFEARFGEDHVLIEHWQRYGLHNPLDLEGRFDPESPPPFGFVALSYRLYVDGRAEVALGGSYLPSCWFYRDWMRCHRRDMRRAQTEEIEAVLAPRRDRAAGSTFATVDVGHGVVHTSPEAAR